MFSLAVSINNVFLGLLVLFVAMPLALLTWLAIGTVLSMFLGPLGYVLAVIMMLYFWSNF